MRITAKGQVTIPAKIREATGLLPQTEVALEFDGDSIRIVPAHTRGRRLTAHLRGRGDVKLSTDEIVALMRGD